MRKRWLDGHHVGDRSFTDSRHLLIEAQTEAGLTGELRVIYELATGQLELHPRAVTFLDRVDRGAHPSADVALALMPDGPDSPVRQEPGPSRRSAGIPAARRTPDPAGLYRERPTPQP